MRASRDFGSVIMLPAFDGVQRRLASGFLYTKDDPPDLDNVWGLFGRPPGLPETPDLKLVDLIPPRGIASVACLCLFSEAALSTLDAGKAAASLLLGIRQRRIRAELCHEARTRLTATNRRSPIGRTHRRPSAPLDGPQGAARTRPNTVPAALCRNRRRTRSVAGPAMGTCSPARDLVRPPARKGSGPGSATAQWKAPSLAATDRHSRHPRKPGHLIILRRPDPERLDPLGQAYIVLGSAEGDVRRLDIKWNPKQLQIEVRGRLPVGLPASFVESEII